VGVCAVTALAINDKIWQGRTKEKRKAPNGTTSYLSFLNYFSIIRRDERGVEGKEKVKGLRWEELQ
jgi:hypothetical protein